MSSTEHTDLVPTCTQGCSAAVGCCECCIYVPNLDEDDLRVIKLEQALARLQDPVYKEQRRLAYSALARLAIPVRT